MGGFYGSVQVRGDDRDAIRPAVEGLSQETGRKFLLGPSLDGWIGIYPADCGQDLGLAGDLARRLPGEVFAVRVHDDDFFAYEFYRSGELVDAYDSALVNGDEAFGEEPLEPNSRPEAFAHLVSDQAGFESLNQRLLTQGTQRDLLATELLEAFAEGSAFGMPSPATITSWKTTKPMTSRDGTSSSTYRSSRWFPGNHSSPNGVRPTAR